MVPAAQQRRETTVVALALIVITLAVYWPVHQLGFINYDDDIYVTANAEVQQGLSRETIAWAFDLDTTVASNWHPLTMLSHLADVSLFGLEPGWHHLTSLALHLLNVLLLLLLLRAAGGSLWCSAFVAALFALHPLNVQSVAWISERKNVLSTTLWLLTLGSYLRYVRCGRWSWPGLTTLLLALGLMAKSMLVTVPCCLLLLDVWPLRRVGKVSWPALLAEKLPLFALVALDALITLSSQAAGHAMMRQIPFSYRLSCAFSGYLTYIGKLLWPHPLSVFYPHPGSAMSPGQLLFGWISAAAICCLTVLVIRSRRRAPWALFGWFWFLGTLVPVIGLVQVGDQAIAERYAYVPAIGLFLIVARGAAAISRDWPRRSLVLSLAAALCLALLGWRTRVELVPWKSSETLFRHALEATPDNYLAHTNLGQALYERGLKNEAMAHMEAAVRANPGYALARANLGTLHAEAGELEEAERLLLTAVEMEPQTARAHTALGAVSITLGKYERAAQEFRRALELDPRFAAARGNLERLKTVWPSEGEAKGP